MVQPTNPPTITTPASASAAAGSGSAPSPVKSANLARLAPFLALAFTLVIAACATTADGDSGHAPDNLALTDSSDPLAGRAPADRTVPTSPPGTTPWTGPDRPPSEQLNTDAPSRPLPPVPHGTPDEPFGPLPDSEEALAVITPTDVILPVVDERENGWLVESVCHGFAMVTEGRPIGRAHVVLDPGHGGDEVGATSPSGLRESDLNLQVATRAAEILEEAGATVVLTRTWDYRMTVAARGRLAKAIEPGLFVSVHHNGGAPPNGDRPGTLVYTKTGSPESTRFGGLFYQVMQPMLLGAAEPKQEAYAAYAEALAAHEAQIAAYDQSVVARDQALVTNGQIPPETTTTVPPTTTVPLGGIRMPGVREVPPTTTTVPASAESTVPVPDTIPLPPAFEGEPVREFRWAGTGNAGVRSWTRSDGEDYLGLLRHSGDVPAVLAEFLFVTNPSEEELLLDPAFIEKEAGALADAIILYFTTNAEGTGIVADQFGDQNIGGGGGRSGCIDPPLR